MVRHGQRHGLVSAGVALALVLAGTAARAQDYRFRVPEAEVTVRVESGGAACILYRIRFECLPRAHPIDVVDIGMPNLGRHRALGARINGQGLPDGAIRTSTYLKPAGCGYEVHLGGATIQPGAAGLFEFAGLEQGMVWQDTTRRGLASLRFSPTWFGDPYVEGETKLALRIVLPIPAAAYPGVKDQILWHRRGQEFQVKGVMEGEERASVGWAWKVRWTGPQNVGVSFPKSFMDAGAVRSDSLWRVFRRWFENSGARPVSGVVLAVLFLAILLYATRLTGWVLLLALEAGLIAGMCWSVPFHLALLLLVPTLGLLVLRWRRQPTRHYFPAKVCLEGGGLKRGLTAVESAIVLERPFPQVLTMVIYGLLRKGAVTIASDAPPRLALGAVREGPQGWCTKEGTPLGLHDYELGFMETFSRHQFCALEHMDLSRAFDRLVSGTARRMRGFSLELTRDYSRFRVEAAWRRVRKEVGFEARCRATDEAVDWLMLDDGWGRSLNDLDLGPRYRPHWWTGHSPGPTAGPAGAGTSALTGNLPQATFADVTSSFCGRVEGLCSRAVAGMDCLALKGVDLSGLDRFTGEMLRELAERSVEGGGGGRGGGCACACAGCACACACAGGGR